MINKVLSPMAYHVDLPPRYRWLHPVFHTLQMKPHIGPIPGAELPVVLSYNDVESEYKAEWVLDV